MCDSPKEVLNSFNNMSASVLETESQVETLSGHPSPSINVISRNKIEVAITEPEERSPDGQHIITLRSTSNASGCHYLNLCNATSNIAAGSSTSNILDQIEANTFFEEAEQLQVIRTNITSYKFGKKAICIAFTFVTVILVGLCVGLIVPVLSGDSDVDRKSLRGTACMGAILNYICTCPAELICEECAKMVKTSESPAPKTWLSSGHKANKTYPEIFNSTIQPWSKRQIHVIQELVWYFSIVNDLLWVGVVSNSTIAVLDTNASIRIKEIHHPRINQPKRATQSNEHVLVAASSGLFVLDVCGTMLYAIAVGTFSDVKIYDKTACSFDYQTNTVFIISLIHGQWILNNTFPAINMSTDNNLRNSVEIIDELIYICSISKLSVYSIHGEFIRSYGDNQLRKEYIPGFFRLPSLCGVDSNGSLLVCDRGDQIFQVLSTKQSKWTVFTLEEKYKISDVVIDVYGNMWLLVFKPQGRINIIYKYSV